MKTFTIFLINFISGLFMLVAFALFCAPFIMGEFDASYHSNFKDVVICITASFVLVAASGLVAGYKQLLS